MAGPVAGLPYSACCSRCGALPGAACVMRRAPFDVCAWPHRERVAAAERSGRQGVLVAVA